MVIKKKGRAMAAKKTDPVNFEQSLEQLGALVEKMEQGHLSLEESLKNFESGIRLIHDCQTALRSAEQKVKILTEKQGEQRLVDFDGITG